MHSISAISPLDGRYKQHTELLKQYASEYGLIRYRVLVEIKWLIHVISKISGIEPLSPDDLAWLNHKTLKLSQNDASTIKSIEASTNHDVKAVEYWIKDIMRQKTSLKQHIELVHFACTSEDINNLAYGLMQQDIRNMLIERMASIDAQLTQLASEHIATTMISRTHGQPASPTTLGKEAGNFIYRLRRQYRQLQHQEIYGKINGAVGNYNAHHLCCPDADWIDISRDFVESLNLTWNPMTTQIEPHDALAEFIHTVIRYNNILLDLCRDIWAYISIGYFTQKTIEGEVGSSTMPHKVNPIDFENAEGNLGLANAMLEHLASKLPVSRWQRDLSDSTVMRNLGSAFGYCFLAYASVSKGIEKLQVNRQALKNDLDNNHEVLAEPVQMLMRYHKMANPYERLKELTRGKKIDKQAMDKFIHSLELPKESKERLLSLSPDNYTGLAKKLLTDFVLEE